MELNESFWHQIKDRIKSRNKENKLVETWVNPISYVDTVGQNEQLRMILGVPSSLHQYFVVENLLDKIYAEIQEMDQKSLEVDIVVVGQKLSSDGAVTEDRAATPQVVVEQTPILQTPQVAKAKNLNLDYTFSTFVVGKNTEFAHAASYNVAQNPGADGYNPLFIFGPVGMGKTHLLHAVGNHIRVHRPQLRINYITGADFMNECIASIRHKTMDNFRYKYRENSDILLVDDVQYIAKGEAVQEEFFHLLNSFFERKKQVVVASDRMPKDILGLEDRSRSRLEWGLIADISMPDIETRTAILRYKAETMGLRISEEVVHFIARISKTSIRQLEGNLKKVKMYSDLQGITIDIDLAKKVLATHDTQSTISVEDIQKLVCDHFQVRLNDLKSTTRVKQIVVPRQIAMFLIKKVLDKSLVDIGRIFGGKDHTTVMNALSRVQHLQESDVDIRNSINELLSRIHNITGV